MSAEVRISIVIALPDEPTGGALPAKTAMLAWEAFTAAIKNGCDVKRNDFYLVEVRRRRRKGRLQVVEPPSAA